MAPSRRDFLSRHLTLWKEFLQSLQPLKPESHSRNGHFIAATVTTGTVYLLVAILVNHIRRVLAPWLGQFLWYHAIEDMKFARSSPHYYLEAATEYNFMDVVVWACWSTAIALLRGLVRRALQGVSEAKRRDHKLQRMVMDVYRVVYLAVLLADVERTYVETCWVGAQLYSYSHLILGNNLERVFLNKLITERWPWAALQWGLVLRWCWRTFVPEVKAVMRFGVLVVVWHGVVWRGTLYLVRYSNKYFLVLQMSDMVVTFGWMGVAGLGYVVMRVGGS